jgi:NCAIR mutase (PurE)-related protein
VWTTRGRFARLPYETVGDFARLDTHRALRTGYPEVVFSQNKTPDQCAQIARRLRESAGCVLLTRANPDVAQAVIAACRPAT